MDLTPEQIQALVLAAVAAVAGSLALVFYFLPTAIAALRGHRHVWAIFWINLFFGVTVLGWITAAFWAIVNKD